VFLVWCNFSARHSVDFPKKKNYFREGFAAIQMLFRFYTFYISTSGSLFWFSFFRFDYLKILSWITYFIVIAVFTPIFYIFILPYVFLTSFLSNIPIIIRRFLVEDKTQIPDSSRKQKKSEYADMCADLEFVDDPEITSQIKSEWIPGLVWLAISDPVTAMRTAAQRFRTR
jgi:hypothetical protein